MGLFGLCDKYEVHVTALRTCCADDELGAKSLVCLPASAVLRRNVGWPSSGVAQRPAFSVSVSPFESYALARADGHTEVVDDQKLVLGHTGYWLTCRDIAWDSGPVRMYWYVVGTLSPGHLTSNFLYRSAHVGVSSLGY